MAKKEEKQEVSKEMLLKRLRRIGGQVHGVEKMIVDGRDCESLITQLAAIRSAIESVEALMLNNLTNCSTKNHDFQELPVIYV